MIKFNCTCGLGGDDGSDAVCCLKCLKWFHKRCVDFEENHLIYLCTRCLPPDPTWLRPGGEGERRKFWIALDFWRVAVRRNAYWAENYDDDTPTPDDFRVPEDDYDKCLALFERSEKPYMYVRLESAATAPHTECDNTSNSIMDKSSSNALAVSLVDQSSRHTPDSSFTVYKKTSGGLLTQPTQHRRAYIHDSPPVELVDDIEQITAALEKVHNFQRISHKNQLPENYVQHEPRKSAFTKKIMPKPKQINELYNLSTNY